MKNYKSENNIMNEWVNRIDDLIVLDTDENKKELIRKINYHYLNKIITFRLKRIK